MERAWEWDGWIGRGLLIYFGVTGVFVFAQALRSALTAPNPEDLEEPLARRLPGAVLFAVIAGVGAPFAFIYNGFEWLFLRGVAGLRAVTGWPPAETPRVYNAEFWTAEHAREIAAGERDDQDDDRDG